MGANNIEKLLRDIERECEYTWRSTGRRTLRPEVMDAMAKVPRDEFVPLGMKPFAFDNNALPIGEGQTISQPFIVALMTDLLDLEPGHRVLEVGTGSGYQAAILSLLVDQVFSIEIIPELAKLAAVRLARLGYNNVRVESGDGYRGWPQHAPFDGIIVTAAASHIPSPLIEQLRPGAKLVLPVGMPFMHQELMLVRKDSRGNPHTQSVLDVAFVPLTGRHQRPEEGKAHD